MEWETTSFNLLDEKWIPVLWADGRVDRVGIRTALTEAGRIRQIAASNPMDRVAILRFLLALLYWCKGSPPDDERSASRDSFPWDWFSRLDNEKECFNLLGDAKRFYQYRRSGAATDERLSANYLVQEVPTGTNKWHFRHSTDETNGLCPACCAMGLLRLPVFATSGGRGKPPGVNSKPPLYVIPVGLSLAETLRLSWQQVSDLGSPAWEKPDQRLPATGNVPLLTGLTWLPRRVWVDDPEEREGACISCGRVDHLILRSVFAPIGSTKTDGDGPGRIWRDPHVLYATSSKGEVTSHHAGDALGNSDAAAGQWSKILAGILGGQQENKARSLWIVGFSTVQNDKYLEAMECLLPCVSPPHQHSESIAKLDRWQKQGAGLARRLQPRNKKGPSRKHVEIPPLVAAIRPHVEDRISAMAGELMAGSDEAWEQAAAEYRPMMETIARSLSSGFTTSAVRRRREIACVAPDVRPNTERTGKVGREKGSGK